MDFAPFDTRGYPTLPVRDGYTAWAPSYEATVLDLMDLRVAERLTSVRWSEHHSALDLACGTGRLGQWLRSKGVGTVDGVDLTPAMLAKAEARDVYRSLKLGEVSSTGLPGAAYSLLCQSLADEHLPRLEPLYLEAARLAAPGGLFVLLGYHPWFLMNGMPTHFDDASGRSLAIESYVHLFSDHVAAAHAAGWTLVQMREALIDDDWIRAKPKWEAHRDRPISFGLVWSQ
jgi:SAM-dependent methyltransferase